MTFSAYPPGRWLENRPILYVRLILCIVTLLSLAQLAQFRPVLIADRNNLLCCLLFIGFMVSLVALLAVSFWRCRLLSDVYGPWLNWLFASPLRTWATAFVTFELLARLGTTVGESAAAMAAAGCIAAISILIAAHLWGNQPLTAQPAPQAAASRSARLGLLLVCGLALIATVITLQMIPPTPGTDGTGYYRYSSALLEGHKPASASFEHFTYGYPGIIALTRRAADTSFSLVLFQHLLRALAAVVVFWSLLPWGIGFAVAAGGWLALSPIIALFANYAMTESVTSSLLVIALVLTYRISRSPRQRWLAFILGFIGGVLTLLRPAETLGMLPLLVFIGVVSRSWNRTLLVVAGFAASVAMFSLVNWRLDGTFDFGPGDTSAYYVFPYIYYNLYNPSNGPLAARVATILSHDYCGYTMPASKADIFAHWPYLLYSNCIREYNQRTGDHQTTFALYLEGIRAQPGKYLRGVTDEIIQFVTTGEQTPISPGEYEILPRYPPQAYAFCSTENSASSLWTYFCAHTISTPIAPLSFDALMAEVHLFQPYRFQSPEPNVRFWTALALLGFIFIESRFRVLGLIAVLMIGYHAVTTAFAQFNIPRYIFILTPIFLITALIFYYTVAERVLAALREGRRDPLPGHIRQAALPLLPVGALFLGGLLAGPLLPLPGDAAARWVQEHVAEHSRLVAEAGASSWLREAAQSPVGQTWDIVWTPGFWDAQTPKFGEVAAHYVIVSEATTSQESFYQVDGRTFQDRATPFYEFPRPLGLGPRIQVLWAFAPQRRLDVLFDGHLYLIGYDLLNATGTSALRLYWYNQQPTPVDYNVFIHMVDADTLALRGQKDGPLGMGGHPSSAWRPNEIVFDTWELPEMRPGTQIQIGIYQLATMTRAQITGADGRALGDTITLLP
jgi:hypothetical protein